MDTEKDVIYQYWMESERGWGQRPDGFSIHLSSEDYKKFVEDYWASMPDEIPDEYSFPVAIPTIRSVPMGAYQELVAEKKEGRLGIRSFQSFENWLLEPKTR